MEAAIELYLLGPIQIRRSGNSVHGFESQKAMALLCYLAELRQPVSRQHLAQLFWGNKSEKRGRANLSRVLHNNTALLPNTLILERDFVQFNYASNIFVDVVEFTELSKQNNIEALRKAVHLYRATFLADLTLENCPEFETWLLTEQEMWKQQVARVFNLLISHCKISGDYEEGLALAFQLLAQDPWREEVHRDIMLMLALSGQRSAALSQYERCSLLLSEELGVNPSAETTALYYRIRAGEIRPTEQSLYSLQPFGQGTFAQANSEQEHAQPSMFWLDYGHNNDTREHQSGQRVWESPMATPKRNTVSPHQQATHRGSGSLESDEVTNEFNQIIERLANPVCRMLTIIGPQNEIQRRLLFQIATTSATAFSDGVFFVTNKNASSDCLLIDLVQSLNMSTSEMELDLLRAQDEKATIGFFKQLRAKELLLVFNEIEPYRQTIHLLESLLKRAPQIKVLVSAKEPLDISEEWLFDMY